MSYYFHPSQLRYPWPALQTTFLNPPLALSPWELARKQSSELSSLKSTWGRGGDENAIAGAFWGGREVESQDAPARIVAAQIVEVDGHAAARLAVVLDHGVGQGPYLLQCEVTALREQADGV